MSTRCQIAFERTKVTIYQHSDGYPEGVLPDLLPFVAEFMSGRGYDECYMPARLVQHLANRYDEAMVPLSEHVATLPGGKGPTRRFLGFGISTELHADIEYLYQVKKDGSVEVCKVSFEGETEVVATIKCGTPVEKALQAMEAA